MSPNGTGQRLLVAHGVAPNWAPDSRRFAYVSVTALNERLAIRVARVDRKSDRLLVRGGDVNAPAWSPDGRRLAFAQGSALMVLRGGVPQDIGVRPGGLIERVTLSADGRWLGLDYEDPSRGIGFEVVRSNGRSPRDLPGVVYTSGAWSPTRPELAYVAEGHFELLDPVTGRIKKLAPAPWYVNALGWAPSGASFAYSSGASFSQQLAATSAVGVVTRTGHVRTVDGGISYPLPDSIAWTTPPAGMRYTRPLPLGPIVSKEELKLRAPVNEIATDGGRVAYRSCGTIGVWQPGGKSVVPIQTDRPLCGELGIGFYSLALAGDRVAWASLQGGNYQANAITAATVGSESARLRIELGFHITGDPRGSERAGDLRGAGSSLFYTTWTYCDDVLNACPGVRFGQGRILSQTLWRLGDESSLRVEPGPLRLLDVEQGRVVVSGDNSTLVLDSEGQQLLALPVSTTAAQLARSDLVVIVPGALRDYDVVSGALLHSWPLPDVSYAGSCGVPSYVCASVHLRLVGEASGIAAYLLDGRLHVLRLGDGADKVVGDATAAALDDSGLAYAYRAGGTWPGRVRFIPFGMLY